MIEHFSKWIELAPFQNKSNERATYALLNWSRIHLVFQQKYSQIKAQNFEKKFRNLCERALIDHRITFHYHHKVDVLAKRIVQAINFFIKKLDYKRGIQVSGTYNYHGWPWDIDLKSKHPLHHFPFTFCFLGVDPNY
jgi:hypothetical protein